MQKITSFYRREQIGTAIILLIVALRFPGSLASAHQGPPFPLLVDKTIGSCIVSIWTDPDIGTGSFFIIIDPAKGGAVPEDLKVEVAVQPVSGRLAEAVYTAVREKLRGQIQYKAAVEFDVQEFWRVRILFHSSQVQGELTAQVEATPPGYGSWDLLLYSFPFAAVGWLWLRAFLKRRGPAKNVKQLQ